MKNLSRDALLMMGVYVIGALINYVYNITMGRLLSPEQYGIFGVAVSFLVILYLFVNAAFPLTITKFLSEDSDNGIKRKVFKSSLVGNFSIALLLSTVFYILYASGIINLEGTYRPLVAFVALALIFSSVESVYSSILQGTFRFKEYGLLGIVETLTKLVSAVFLVLLGFGAIGAFLGIIAGTIIRLLLAVFFTSNFKYWKTDGWANMKIFSFALPIFFATLFMTLLMNLDMLGVKFLSEKTVADTFAGYYRSALLLSQFPVFITIALMGVMFPYISKYSSVNNNYSPRLLKYVILFICPVSIALFVVPSSFIALVFPSSYTSASEALGILSLGMGFFVVISVLAGIFQAMHHPKVPAFILMISVVIDVAALLFLVPKYGIQGAATSTTIACAAGLLGLTGASLKYSFFKFDYINAIKTVMTFILFGFSVYILPHGTKFSLILDIMLSATLYIIFLFIIRLLREEDIKIMLSGFNLGNNMRLEKITENVKNLIQLLRG